MATKKLKESNLFRVVNFERVKKGFKNQGDLSKKLKKQDPNLWDGIRKGSTKFHDVCKICETLDLQLIIRNKETNTEHILTKND